MDQTSLEERATQCLVRLLAKGYKQIALWPGKGRKAVLSAAQRLGIEVGDFDPARQSDAVVLTELQGLIAAKRSLEECALKNGSSFMIVDDLFDEEIVEARGKPRIHFDPTNTCNLKCAYCYRQAPFPKDNSHMQVDSYSAIHGIPLDEVVTVSWHDLPPVFTKLQDFKHMLGNLGEIGALNLSCAHEPLLHPQILEMVEAASELPTMLVTNTVLLSDEIIEGLVRHGLDTLAISLDSHDDVFSRSVTGLAASKVLERIARVGEIKAVMGSAKPGIVVSMVLCKDNMDHVLPLLEILKGYGVDQLNACRILPRTKQFAQQAPSSADIEILSDTIKELNGKPVHVYFGYNDSLRLHRLNDCCTMPFEYCYVEPEGDIYTCYRERIGNIFQESLQQAHERHMQDLTKAARCGMPYCRHCYL